ncbi:MAG TPA: GGDEF domain-containing protein [Candidatus Obscuribacterales bacterium]
MPHGYCFLWDAVLTALHAVSDSAIAAAYLSIPAMMYISRDRASVEIRPLLLMFAAFILSCGIGHLFSAWNIWHGNYWLEGLWKVVIAVISLATAWQLRQMIPSMMGVHRQLSETESLANTDQLTGLANRRGLEQAIHRLTRLEATPSDDQAVLMLIDLDHFKDINDTYGHIVGDRLLVAVAQVLVCHTRATDIVARLGGDEFAVILRGCSLLQGQAIAETIRIGISHVELTGMAAESIPSLVTASIGLQHLDLTAPQSFAEMFQPVDQLLYASKQGGRDRITYSPETL